MTTDAESAPNDLIDAAVTAVSGIKNTKDRARAASALLTGLLEATRAVKDIRQAAVVKLHKAGDGYGAIALDLGLSRGRVQQIVNDVASGNTVHRDQTRRRQLKALITKGRKIDAAAAELGLDVAEAERLVKGSDRPPGRPKTAAKKAPAKKAPAKKAPAKKAPAKTVKGRKTAG